MKITKILLCLTICGLIIYGAYQPQTKQWILDAYQQLTSDGTSMGSDNKPAAPKPIPDKAQIDFLLQQQYQKSLNQQPEEDELSDSERLQMLEDALHELDTAEDESDRELAVMTLGELHSAEARQGIVTALHDESKLVVSQAIRQINKWPDAAIRTEMLLTALGSNNEEIVEETLLTINDVDDKRLIARLKQLSKHANPDIREAANLALNLAP
jgi:HEAT repeat protein